MVLCVIWVILVLKADCLILLTIFYRIEILKSVLELPFLVFKVREEFHRAALNSIKINNIVKVLNPGVDCSLYVDDFLICNRSNHMHTIECQLQQCLNKIQKWALENSFKFSKTKTQCMHLCQLRGLHNDPVLKLDGVEIHVVDQYTF